MMSMASSASRVGGPRAQGVLQAQAFLMAQHLMRCRLSDVNDSLAGQMLGRNEVGIVHRSPPEERRGRRGYGFATWGESVPELVGLQGIAPRIAPRKK